MLQGRSRIAIITCLPDQSASQKWFRFRRQTNQDMGVRLCQQVIPAMRPSLITAPSVTGYPWCFVAPATTKKGRYYYTGAFLPHYIISGQQQPIALYALVSDIWLQNNMQALETLPFWLARVLATLPIDKAVLFGFDELREWCRILPHMLSPHRQVRDGDRLQQRREALRGKLCDADFNFESRDGVDAMPWMDWPGCARNNGNTWIWRQSRYGKIIESQKIVIKRDPINQSVGNTLPY